MFPYTTSAVGAIPFSSTIFIVLISARFSSESSNISPPSSRDAGSPSSPKCADASDFSKFSIRLSCPSVSFDKVVLPSHADANVSWVSLRESAFLPPLCTLPLGGSCRVPYKVRIFTPTDPIAKSDLSIVKSAVVSIPGW